MNEYNELEKVLEDSGVNEINFTDSDAKTVKFGAHQGTDVGYNVQAAVDSKNKLITTFEVINNSADQGQLYNMGTKVKEIFGVNNIDCLADKGYFDPADFKNCEQNQIACYVPRIVFANSIGDSVYYNDKFIYNPEDNTYKCPEGQILECKAKKQDAAKRTYSNYKACNNCSCKTKCTTAKEGRIITRTAEEDYVDIVNKRTKENKVKYHQRQEIVEHVFGTVKRSMNFSHFILRGLRKVSGEVSVAFFCYNLKRVINILGLNKLTRTS